ncbi:MAG: hypothetical protein K1X64_19985 [Myxococcaceae bacterium]|nr:hypothetical protein [Myxococcaceae bacterium]
MDLKTMKDTPPWDWPDGSAAMFLEALGSDRMNEADRLVAAELAGDSTVINDALVDALLTVLRNVDESESIRTQAATSLGPVLEYADMEGFDDDGDAPISEQAFKKMQSTFHELLADTRASVEIRRRILEASVRAPQDWHPDAVRAAYSSEDDMWKLTAVFCMRFITGFDEQIVEALDSKNPDIYNEALLAAGNWGIEAAWPHVVALISTDKTPKPLLLAAIEAIPSIRPEEAPGLLTDFTDADDEDIVSAAYEALAMAEGSSNENDEEENDLVPIEERK